MRLDKKTPRVLFRLEDGLKQQLEPKWKIIVSPRVLFRLEDGLKLWMRNVSPGFGET